MKFRNDIARVVPYEPGKPAEELMRERGLDHVIKLASNEGPWGPLPRAARIIADGIGHLNRYPDGATVLLRDALAELHNVHVDRVIVAHGADAIINYMSTAMLEPGSNVVFGWPSFASYHIDAVKMGAEPRTVPLTDDTYDLDALLAAIDDNTRIVYVCNPNNPTGTMVTAAQLDAFMSALPDHVLPVIDEAYFEYVVDADYPDSITRYAHAERPVVVLRTFSKIYGLAGLRVGYAIAPTQVVDAVNRVRNAFDVNALAQAAAVASIEERALISERIAANTAGLEQLAEAFTRIGLTPIPSVANFVCVRVPGDANELYDRLLDEGIIVRPLTPFGMTDALRVTVGTPSETEQAIAAFERVMAHQPA